IVLVGGQGQRRGAALRRQHLEKRFEMFRDVRGRLQEQLRRLAARHLGKRASGITFSTGAEGGGGFQKARKAVPPSSSRAITMTNATVTFPIPPRLATCATPMSMPNLSVRIDDKVG